MKNADVFEYENSLKLVQKRKKKILNDMDISLEGLSISIEFEKN